MQLVDFTPNKLESSMKHFQNEMYDVLPFTLLDELKCFGHFEVMMTVLCVDDVSICGFGFKILFL